MHAPNAGILQTMTDLEVDVSTDASGKAIIEGKTSVPFRTFVTLILQRRVQMLFKSNADDPVIVSSELLTSLASAPNDKREDTGRLVLVTFGVGILAGVFLTVAAFLSLLLLRIPFTPTELAIVLGVLCGIAFLGALLQRQQKRSAFRERLHEAMEKTADLLSR